LRDWPEELEGQRELRRLAEDIAVHLPTCPEETVAAGCVLICVHFECEYLHCFFREKILLNITESWLYVIPLYLVTAVHFRLVPVGMNLSPLLSASIRGLLSRALSSCSATTMRLCPLNESFLMQVMRCP
jgi:hypothetical protein